MLPYINTYFQSNLHKEDIALGGLVFSQHVKGHCVCNTY